MMTEENKKPKVVFTFVEAGFGHMMPAQAISDAFEKKYGEKCEIIRWNIFSDNKDEIIKKYASSLFGWAKNVCNNKILFLGEIFSNWIGSKTTLKILDKKFKKAKKIIMDEIVEMNPDLICNTYYSPSHFALECKKLNMIDTIVATYTPDPIVYPAWDRRSDLYFVNNKQAYNLALKTGFKQESVIQVPFVLRKEINTVSLDKKIVRKNLGLCEDKFTIVLASGAYGMKKDKFVIDALLKANIEANIVVICGKNEDLLHYCEQKILPKNSKISFYPVGFTNKMFEYNSASNLFIGKSGANALVESFYFKVPAIVTSHANPLEIAIAKYYIDKLHCGVQIFNPNKVVKFVKEFMQNFELQQAYIKNLTEFNDASGAEKVADELYKALQIKFNLV